MIAYEKRASVILYNLLKSLPDDRPFLLPSNVCPIVPLTFLKANRTFEFVDISLDNLCMDQVLVLDKLKLMPAAYAGVLFVRTYGLDGSFEDFFKSVKQTDSSIVIIDDKCLCPPYVMDAPGAFSDMVLYSTGYSKIVDLGFGGYGVLRDGLNYESRSYDFDPAALSRMTAQYKSAIENQTRFEYIDTDWMDASRPELGLPEYFSTIESRLDTVIRGKQEINRIYKSNLPREVCLDENYQLWRFNIFLPEKPRLLKRIFDAGLFASSHYAPLDAIFSSGRSANSERLHSGVVNLFNSDLFDVEMALRLTEIVNDHLESVKNEYPQPLSVKSLSNGLVSSG